MAKLLTDAPGDFARHPRFDVPSLGWVFLGRYEADGSWVLPRSADLEGLPPEELSRLEATLSMDVNLRDGPFVITDPQCHYDESKVVGHLPAGRTVVVKKVVRLQYCDSYIWAEVGPAD